MLEKQILSTLRFFDLQDLPLTQFEIYKYLLADPLALADAVDGQFELKGHPQAGEGFSLEQVIASAARLKQEEKIGEKNGYYTLPGRINLVSLRLTNYGYGLGRERRIRRYLTPTRFLPFIRGIALAGSQPFGQQRIGSDIDLFIMTDSRFMWTARTFLTAYFQVLGMRRHGKKIANRFCLNHYLARSRAVDAEKNLYKAMEYLKLRPVVSEATIVAFQQANKSWIQVFFPNADFPNVPKVSTSRAQKFLEKVYMAIGGEKIEKQLGKWQLARIRQDKFIFVRDDELSFHPESKHEALLSGFFEFHKQ
jgi:hypothetical protein